ncbi:MAG: hypothetical protein K8U03_12705 [Planctomycetia bacterium]|nr:hypothetical protein [Planctomycetia bacterium]
MPSSIVHIRRLIGLVAPACIVVVAASVAQAQQPAAHYQFQTQNPPGAVAAARLQRGGPVVGYFQPVEMTGPKGVLISLADQGGWTEPTEGAVFAGMQIGTPYRIKLSNLPEQFRNLECYPTIEIIDRTYAPVGMERRFPIPVIFNEDDLRLATDGLLVTRVVYIEDPKQALPGTQQPGEQLWHDAGAKANPLEVADRLGRPVAIVRLGGRTPDESAGPDMHFIYGCPKWLRIVPLPALAQAVPTTMPIPTPAPQPITNGSSRRATAVR